MKKTLKSLAAPLLCGLFIFLLFRHVLFIGYVGSASMEPAVSSGSCVAGSRIMGAPERGDILAFRHNGQMLVKRVAAVPGDTVCIGADGGVSVNNAAQAAASSALSVPEGCYFMLGDNAAYSIDSRAWEYPFIKRAQIVAKLWLAPRGK